MKKIITIKRSTLGTNIVFRSPLSRKWLFNITIAPKYRNETLEIRTTIPNVLGKIGYGLTLAAVTALFLGACSPTSNEVDTSTERPTVKMSYVADSLEVFKSCWYPTSKDSSKDSLVVSGRGYTVSERSRYRAAEEPVTFGDVEAEGAVTLMQEKFFTDTKAIGSSVVVLNRCGLTATDYQNGVR